MAFTRPITAGYVQPGGVTVGSSTSTGDTIAPPPKPAPKPAPAPVVSGGTSAPTGPTADQTSALDIVNQTLADYGLSDLSSWAWGEILKGATSSQVLLDLYQQPEFKAQFPEIAMRQQAGLPPIKPGDIVNYRDQATQIMQAAGLPKGFWDSNADFTNLIGNDISIDELRTRVGLAQQATFGVPQEVRDTLARDYGMTDGHLTAQFLDPGKAEPLLARDFLAAQIGGTATVAGYQTNRTQNERLADLGVSQSQAQQGFTQLAHSRQLMSSLPGENTTGISQDQQLAAVFGGDAEAQRLIAQRASEREAQFAGGGQVSTGQGGYSGAGAAQGA